MQPQKRVVLPPGYGGGAAAAAPADGIALRVSTQSTKDEIGIQTLVGDYEEKGTNHGKKVYQKVQKISGHEDVKVFMYYWDARDGADFSGWWFGDQVGGSQVWARCVQHGLTPPRVGWRIPWDSPAAEAGLLFVDAIAGGGGKPAAAPAAAPAFAAAAAAPVNSAATAAATAASTPAAQSLSLGGVPETLKGRVTKAATLVDEVDVAVKAALNEVKGLTMASPDKQLNDGAQALQEQQTALMDCQKSLTQDITEARKGGASATGAVTELQKLSPRLRTLQAGLTAELTKLKGFLTKKQANDATAKKQAEQAAANKAAEERDTAELEETMPATKAMVTSAEESADAVVMMAAPLIAEPPDDEGDLLKKAMEEIEAAAGEAQNKIAEARQQINVKLQAARKFAPETRKNALGEFSSMQQKLTEAQKKVNPYKSFQKEFKARVAARASLQDMADKLNNDEVEVEKVKMMTATAEAGQMSEDELKSSETVVTPVKTSLETALRTIDGKLRTADGPMKEELTIMKDRATGLKKGLDSVVAILSKQKQTFTARDAIKVAAEKVDKAEEALAKCQEAEMPFLKGIEVLPGEESTQAINECVAAGAQADQAMGQAKAFLAQKTAEAKRYVEELAVSTTEELTSQQKRLDIALEKLGNFKKDTNERKLAAIMAEVTDAVVASEQKVEILVRVADIFSQDDLDAVSTEALKEAVEKTAEAEKAAAAAMLEVRKVFAAKQKDAKGPDASAALAKIQTRINTAQQELAKTRKAAAGGEKLIKGKQVLLEEDEKIKKMEEEINESVKKVKPDEEAQALGIEAAQPTDEEVESMGTMLLESQKNLKLSSRVVEAQLAGSPPSLKASLQKLVDRTKSAGANITEVLALTKDQRERVVSESYVKQGKEKTDEVDQALEKVNEAELPFLKGIEILPLKETTETITASETAAAAVQTAVSAARTFIASKNLEIKKFGEAASKPAAEEFALLTERINAAAAKLGAFRKDTEGRKKTAQMQEAAEKMTTVEEEVKKLSEVVEPFLKKAEDEEGKDAEPSEEECEKLVQQATVTQQAMDETRTFLAMRTRDVKGNAAHEESLKGLQARLSEAQKEMAKSKKFASAHEQKYLAKKLIAETEEKLESMQSEIEKTTAFCAPLLEQGGEPYLVSASVRTLAAAFREHMATKELTHEQLFKEISGGAGSISKGVFVPYLQKLPEAIGHEELSFTADRREAIFQNMATDEKGDGNEAITLTSFTEIFVQKFICVKEISVTDVFEISKSKTVAKVDAGGELQTDKGAKKDEAGMLRIECTAVATGKSGFVTMQGNGGTEFITLVSPFSIFCKEMDKVLDDNVKSVAAVAAFFNEKMKGLTTAVKDSPLANARAEMTKLRAQVSTAQQSLNQVKAKATASKREYAVKEQKEKNAHIEAKEKKEADALLAPATAKVEAMEKEAAALEEATKPLVSLSGADLLDFATPVSLVEAAEKIVEAITSCVEDSKKAIADQQGELPKTVKGAMMVAKQELTKMSAKVDACKKKAGLTMNTIHKKCDEIVEARIADVSGLLRAQVQQKDISVEKFFLELVTPGDERISEQAFCSYIQGLQGESFKAEQMSLLCRHLDAGGIGRRRFASLIQQYFVVVKGIAITDEFEISKAKTLRKAELEEVIELVDGPKADDKLGVQRIKGKSLKDNVEGWISLKGNQGTPFLQEVEKPYYSCKAEVSLDRDFKSEGAEGSLRTMAEDEVLELIEGPRKETFAPGIRVKGKANTDGALGWFTARDKNGTIFAEADSKYYACISSVAMTDNEDIKDCKVIRKLAAGELFTVEEGPTEQKEAGITRVKGKSLKDEQVGWITVKGNAGTVYAEASGKHFCVLKDVPLTKKFPSSNPGEEVRVLAKGEAVQALEGPKEESFAPEVRVKVKAMSDGMVGWMTLKNNNVKPWTPYYKCKAAAPIHDTLAVEGAKEVRQAEANETFELMEGPTQDGKVLRMKARAEKDGVLGWVTIKDAEGKRFFES